MDNTNKKYKYAVTYRFRSNIGSAIFDTFDEAFEYFWSIRYKAYSVYKVDALTNDIIEDLTDVKGIKV